MKRSLGLALVVSCLLAGTAHADGLDNCTAEAKDKWKPIEEVEKVAAAEGYVVSKSKVEGTCYEVYGTDKDGKLWELFYNPVDAKLMEKEAKG